MLARSVVAVGVCANATLASRADPARPAIIYFANMGFLLETKWSGEKRADTSAVPIARHFDICEVPRNIKTPSETAPIWRYAVIAMQLCFLRAVAPVEILV